MLDFGLARAFAGDGTGSDVFLLPTITTDLHPGAIAGTPAYMSPEQARGQVVDKRTDIWAFGCVLYEMLTGRLAFPGETISDSIAAILEREPEWSALPAHTPAGIRQLLRRCLEKDPDRRLQDIAEARIEIDDARSGTPQDGPVASAPAGTPAWILWAFAVGLLAVAAAAAGVWTLRPVESDKTGRLEIYLRQFPGPGIDTRVSTEGGSQARWNRNGKELFYVAADDALMAVPIRFSLDQKTVEPGTPLKLFVTNVGSTAVLKYRQQYIVSPDGQSFIMNAVTGEASASPISVILNWKPTPASSGVR